jgi:nitrite reductase/ring-hydroxylating ferredoxin subunit/uncharacterized membrane protein
MRSRASFRGHPLHAALIPFPFAFLYGALLFDLAGLAFNRASFWTTAGHLAVAGVGAALIAAVPGAVDYARTVPPRSTGRQRARKHAAATLGAVVLIAVAWFLRPEAGAPGMLVLAMEAAAAGLLTVGGWMGGTLVVRNQIGVDHRYANAGKWRELKPERVDDGVIIVRRPDDLGIDQLVLVRAEGRRIVLGRTEDGFVAFDDRCTHRGGSLAGGSMICGTVQCPWHGSQFDARSGGVRAGPATEPIATHDVQEQGETLHLRERRT